MCQQNNKIVNKTERLIEKVEDDKVKSEELPPPKIDTDNDEMFNGSLESKNSTEEIAEKKTERLLIIGSYLSIIYVYAQFSLLLYLIGISTVKLGMMFMLVCATAIGYLIIKVNFFFAYIIR